MGMGTGNALGQQPQSGVGKGGAQPQPQQNNMGGKGKGGSSSTLPPQYTNPMTNYTTPQFQQPQNPYMNYYAQQQQQRNPYAQTQFGQMPGQQYNPYQQTNMGGKGKGGGMSGPPQANPYNSGAPIGGGMFGGLRQSQNPYSPQINYNQQPEQPFMGGYDRGYPQQEQMASSGLSQTPLQKSGMGGKGAPDTSREAYNQHMALASFSGTPPSYEQWSAQRQQGAMGLKEGMGDMGGKGGQQQLPGYAQPYMQAMMQNQQRQQRQQRQQLPQYAQQGQPQSLSALQSMLRGMPR
jgi:hypothetical protein